ncbi:MAG: carbohydrate ABC transporter permease [Chloroflexota bacterium]|nr:carbohydrate ABC transporter permease [Chloroflexota bacterium]
MTNTGETLQASTIATGTKKRRNWGNLWKTIAITLLVLLLLAAFLAPFLQMLFIAFSTTDQITELGAPEWPAEAAVFEYGGEVLDVYVVPFEDGTQHELAIVKKGRKESIFVDPANPEEEILWQGSWRSLDRPWTFAPTTENFFEAWNLINFPRLFFNTLAIAVIGIIGTVISCTLVAYGFSRFRFPGRDILFIILISTIFLPAAVTVVPTYTFFVKIGWVGTWLPLLVPHFFANAYNTFLLRQYFMTIPHDLDDAARIDGAGSFRILLSIILPLSWPVIVAVTLFHLVFAWNDYFAPLIYLSTKPELQPIAVGLAFFNGIYGSRPPLIQAAALMALILPVIIFFLAQRWFIQGVVITGVEK